MRMLQPSGEFDLPMKSVGAERGCQIRMEHLQRHRAIVLQVVGEVDRGHPAATQLALDAVPLRERRTKSGVGIGQIGTRGWRRVKNLRLIYSTATKLGTRETIAD